MPYGYDVENDDTKDKEYRRWISGPLEEDEDYMPKRPFDTYQIMRG